jgi:hypothetical protein
LDANPTGLVQYTQRDLNRHERHEFLTASRALAILTFKKSLSSITSKADLMKPTTVLALSWILLTSDGLVHAQEFQNLDFEQAMPDLSGPLLNDRYQDAANVLPHWLVNAGDPGFYGITYNTFGHVGYGSLIHVFGGDGVSTDDPPSPNQYRAVAGNYSAALNSSNDWASLQQTGLIPSGSRSLRFSGYIAELPFFESHGHIAYGDVDVSLNSLSLPIHDLGPVVGATFRRGGEGQVFQYGVNIPPGLAGTTATLRFYTEGLEASPFLVLDDVQFSPVAIPEPATLGLAAISAVALITVRRRTKAPRA